MREGREEKNVAKNEILFVRPIDRLRARSLHDDETSQSPKFTFSARCIRSAPSLLELSDAVIKTGVAMKPSKYTLAISRMSRRGNKRG